MSTPRTHRTPWLSAGVAASAILSLATGTALGQAINDGFEAFRVVEDSRVRFDRLALEDLQAEAQADALAGGLRRFAVPNPVSMSPAEYGVAETTPDGRVIWRYRIESDNAMSVNLGTRFEVPPSTVMYVLDENGDAAFRALTADDNRESGELWTPVVSGPTAELYVEVNADEFQDFVNGFQITSVNLGFTGFGTADAAAGGPRTSAACNIDVACPEADPWRTEVNSVGVYTLNGFGVCSGALINNTARDGRPLFMTAYHCLRPNFNVNSMVVFWNFQNSTCRTPGSPASGGPGDGPDNQFTFGGDLLMLDGPSDWALVELDNPPNVSFGVTYAGWDRRVNAATPGVGISHPDTDEKRISIEDQTPAADTIFNFTADQPSVETWRVQWDAGGIEGGSSGSPFFNSSRRVIGTGTAATLNVICTNQFTWYGRLSSAWTGGGTPETRLSDWLDPINTGELEIESIPDTIIGPNPPQLLSPADGSTQLPIPVTLNWDDTFLAESFEVLVIDTDASSVAFNGPAADSFITLGDDVLSPGRNYQWQVTAVNAVGATPSAESFSFSTQDPPPADFALLTPADGATDITIPVQFSWEAAAGADEYAVLVLDSDTPALVTSFTTTDTSFELDETQMNPGTSYSWRVTASNTTGSLLREGTFATADAATCSEDLTGDGAVGPSDLFQLLAAFGTSADGDVDGDGTTGPSDLFQLLAAFGTSC